MVRFAAPFISLVGLSAIALTGCGPKEDIVELAPAALEISTKRLEFGEVARGDRLDKEVTITNAGDVPMGIKGIFLASAEDSDAGHVGSYRLLWNCGDVVVPDLNDTDAATSKRMPPPPDDTADSGFETGFETGDTGRTPTSSECVLPGGGRLTLRVRFQPTRAGGNRDSIIIETYGDDPTADENTGKAPDEYNHRDLDTTWKQIFLIGEGGATTPRALITPKTLDFGFVFARQERTQYFAIRNAGDGELRLLSVGKDGNNCSDNFTIKGPTEVINISGSQAQVVSVTYDADDDGEDRCRIRVVTDDPQTEDSEIETTVLAVVNGGSNPANKAPQVIIHSPAPGYAHQGMGPIPLELTVFDENEPADGLYCKVRSALQGIPDGRPALADCRPDAGNPSGHQIVPVPVDFYVQPGLEVLLVRVTDSSGVTHEASLPVLINASYPPSDDDGDGFGRTGTYRDCDDTNPSIYPLSAEMFDGRDNDCDRLIDEGTDGFDDDGDGMSEAQGDCDDTNPETYKGGPELRDTFDNDCDGIVDETTEAYDDDGDGYTELERDCDDNDPSVFPGAVELCGDGVDNDCDQIPDVADPGGCQSTDSIPMIVGRIDLARTSIEEGDTVAAFVETYEEDGDALTYEWEVQGGAGEIDDPTAATINWTAPDTVSARDLIGDVFRIYAVVRDDDGNQDWKFEQIWMYRTGDLNNPLPKVVQVDRGGAGCSTSAASSLAPWSFGLIAGLGLLGAAVRRRRD